MDKMYLMRKTLPIRVKKDKEFTHHLQAEVFNKVSCQQTWGVDI